MISKLQQIDIHSASKFQQVNDELEDEWLLLVLLWMCTCKANTKLCRGVHLLGRFNLLEYTEYQRRVFYRFNGAELVQLQHVTEIPEMVMLNNGTWVPGLEVICLSLRRFSYPSRWLDIQIMFRRDLGTLSRMFAWFVLRMFKKCRKLLWFDRHRMTRTRLMQYAAAIHHRGAPIARLWGFIDGTFIRCARPSTRKCMQVYSLCSTCSY